MPLSAEIVSQEVTPIIDENPIRSTRDDLIDWTIPQLNPVVLHSKPAATEKIADGTDPTGDSNKSDSSIDHSSKKRKPPKNQATIEVNQSPNDSPRTSENKKRKPKPPPIVKKKASTKAKRNTQKKNASAKARRAKAAAAKAKLAAGEPLTPDEANRVEAAAKHDAQNKASKEARRAKAVAAKAKQAAGEPLTPNEANRVEAAQQRMMHRRMQVQRLGEPKPLQQKPNWRQASH
jgi:hypothetical protein